MSVIKRSCPSSERSPCVALLFFGLTRNLKYTYPSIFKYIFCRLREKNIAYDTFLHTYQLDYLTNWRSNEYNVPLDAHEWKLLQPVDYLIDDQNIIDATVLPHDEFCTFENPWPLDVSRNSMRNMLRQLYSLHQVWKLVADRKEYDAYLILRPDMEYVTPLEIDPPYLPIRERVAYLPTWGRIRHGDNDRLMMTSKEGASIVMTRYTKILDYARSHTPNSHTFLTYILETSQIRREPWNIVAKRVRANRHVPSAATSKTSFFVMDRYRAVQRLYPTTQKTPHKNSLPSPQRCIEQELISFE